MHTVVCEGKIGIGFAFALNGILHGSMHIEYFPTVRPFADEPLCVRFENIVVALVRLEILVFSGWQESSTNG